MARTLLNGPDGILAGSLTRALQNTTLAGSAVITKVIAGTNVTITYTGVDAGTGDVTISNANPLAAGTASLAPLVFNSGVNTTTAVAGALEYNGVSFFASASASNRGQLPILFYANLASAYTLTSQTAAQKLFNSTTNGTITLPIGTYEFECLFSLSSMSATSGSFGFALGGTATITQAWQASANKTSTPATATAEQSTYNTAANTALATASTATTASAMIKGIFRVSVAGTVIPQVSLGVAAAAIVGIDSYFRLTMLGSNVNQAIGPWT